MPERARPSSPETTFTTSWLLVLALVWPGILGGCRAHTNATPARAGEPVQWGLTIVHQDGSQPLQTYFVDSDRIRIENGGPTNPVIIDARAQRVLFVFGDERTYVEMGPKEVDLFNATAPTLLSKSELEHANQELEQLPAKEREAAKATLALMAGGNPPRTFERTAEKKTIDGIACDVYRVTVGGEPLMEECISPWTDGLFRREEFAKLAVYYRSIKNLGVPAGEIFGSLDSYPGFPLTRTGPGAALPSKTPRSDLPRWENRSVKRMQLPVSLFTAPPGFTKKERPSIPGSPAADPGPPMNI